MTTQEVNKEIERCECQIMDSYERLRNSAIELGEKAYQAACGEELKFIDGLSGQNRKWVLASMILLVLGFIFCVFISSVGIFAICIGVGMLLLKDNADNKKADVIKWAHKYQDDVKLMQEILFDKLSGTIDK